MQSLQHSELCVRQTFNSTDKLPPPVSLRWNKNFNESIYYNITCILKSVATFCCRTDYQTSMKLPIVMDSLSPVL